MLARLRTSFVFSSKPDDDERPSPTKRHSHRLSKPPTNTSSSNLLAFAAKEYTSNPIDVSPISTSNGFDPVNTSLTGERRSRQDAREIVRTHLFGEPSEFPPGVSEEEAKARISLRGSQEEQTWLSRRGSLVGNLKDRLSRSGSLVSQIASSKGSSSHLPGVVNDSRLSLVAESVIVDTDPSHEWILNRVQSDEWTAKNYVTSPVHETSQDLQFAPIRRRSLLTPGIATRIPSDILRKPPPPESFITQNDLEYYFNPEYPETSPLSQLEALDLAEEEWVMPTMRTATPCELDYSHLGGLKPGTLHVTNGSVSPAPSDVTPHFVRRRSSPELRSEDDYFSASVGWDNEDTKRGRELERADNDDEHENHQAPLRLQISRSGTVLRTLQTQRSGSPLKYEQRIDVDDPSDTDDVGRCTPRRSTQPSPQREVLVTSPDRTSSLAEEYMAELPTSPFSFQRSPSPRFESTSKATEFDDQLFDDEGVFDSLVEDLERSRLENAYAFPDSHKPRSEIRQAHGIHSDKKDGLPKVLSKADSGYSSNASLRSFKSDRESRTQEVKAMISSDPILESTTSLAESAQMDTNAPLKPESAMALESRPENDTIKSKSLRPSILVKSKTVTAPAVATLAAYHRSTDTVATVSSTNSASVGEAVKRPKKLRKQRPLSQPPPAKYITVQGYREMAKAHIPPVPSEVASRLAERSQKVPELTRTFKSLHHTRSSTSLSGVPFTPVTIRFPSPTDGMDSPHPLPSLPNEVDGNHADAPRPPPHRDYRRLRTSRSERRSSQQRVPGQADLAATWEAILDFGTVTESVGSGPYDAARSFLPPKLPRGADNRHLSHPHNISSNMPRAQSMTGMDAQDAAELARLKSKTLADRRELSWEEKQRVFNDRGGIPGKKVRPKSFVMGAPPVPSLPSPQQVKECEIRRASAERPSLDLPYKASKKVAPEIHAPKPMKLAKQYKPVTPPPQFAEQPKSTVAAVVWPAHAAAVEFHKSWEPHREAWKARRKSAGEGLFVRRTSEEAQPVERPQPKRASRTVAATSGSAVSGDARSSLGPRIGRYGGGLGYAYERGAGFGGSAGTRSMSGMAGGSRKGVELSEGYGIDLSDVPIIAGLRRM